MGRVSDVVKGEDGLVRCAWGSSTPEYRAYHDDEWGRPVGDERVIYEMLCLEGFQAGLSWSTILRKRAGFRAAFANFDPAAVSQFDDDDIDRLLGDSDIVRNRAKIVATINNARATLALRDEGTSLPAVVWRHQARPQHAHASLGDLAAETAESKALSKELRTRGFAFVGPTTVYSAMQAVGVVNDHLRGCHWREVCDRERAAFTVPV